MKKITSESARKKVKILAVLNKKMPLEMYMVVVESLEYINVGAIDVKKSIEFYTLFLDFELIKEAEDYALVSFDELKLKINKYEIDREKDYENELPLFSFILDVDDFTEAIQVAEQENVPIATGPNDFESGAGESIILKDPSGNLIELFYRE